MDDVFTAATANSQTANYFNGATGLTNYVQDAGARNTLLDHLTKYVGRALGCDGTAADYTGRDNMTVVHQWATPVNKAAFETFNRIIIEVCSAEHRSAVLAICVIMSRFTRIFTMPHAK